MCLDYSSSPKFNLFSDPEYLFEEQVTEPMGEPTMEEYMTKIQEDYGSGFIRPKVNEKARFELNGQFLKDLRDNAFSGTNGEDAVEHIEKFLKIVDSLDIPNDLTYFFWEYYPPSRTGRIMEGNEANTKVEWDPTNIEFRSWLASKFRNHKIMDRYTKNALWDYSRRGDDEEVIIDDELDERK
ncbi:hypothetical protein Tco_1185629 [Tanacetum coccineum]